MASFERDDGFIQELLNMDFGLSDSAEDDSTMTSGEPDNLTDETLDEAMRLIGDMRELTPETAEDDGMLDHPELYGYVINYQPLEINFEESIYRVPPEPIQGPPHVEHIRDEEGIYIATIRHADGTIITLRGSETIDFGYDLQLEDTFSGGPIEISLVDDDLEPEIDYSEVDGTTIQEIIEKWKGGRNS